MKKVGKKQPLILNKENLEHYKRLSIGLENCENFNMDIADILDISCEAYRYPGGNRYGGLYHTDDGYIVISSRARETLSDFADDGPTNKDIEDYKLYKRMSLCDDMCSFSLLDKSDRWHHIFVPYGALESAVHHNEIDYANCPSFEVLENGDMEIRFGKLSKNPIIPRNSYSDLVEDWAEVLGDFNPKTLKLKVRNRIVQYEKGEESFVRLDCTILNKKRKNIKVIFFLNDFDKMGDSVNEKIENAHAIMSRLCSGNIYFGIEGCFWVSCKSCKVLDG